MEIGTARPHQLKVDIRLITAMATEEIQWLRAWSAIKVTTFEHFAPWLAGVLDNELDARDGKPVEREMVQIPRLTPMELADFVSAIYVLERLPLTDAQSIFVDKLSILILADTVSALQQSGIGTLVT